MKNKREVRAFSNKIYGGPRVMTLLLFRRLVELLEAEVIEGESFDLSLIPSPHDDLEDLMRHREFRLVLEECTDEG